MCPNEPVGSTRLSVRRKPGAVESCSSGLLAKLFGRGWLAKGTADDDTRTPTTVASSQADPSPSAWSLDADETWDAADCWQHDLDFAALEAEFIPGCHIWQPSALPEAVDEEPPPAQTSAGSRWTAALQAAASRFQRLRAGVRQDPPEVPASQAAPAAAPVSAPVRAPLCLDDSFDILFKEEVGVLDLGPLAKRFLADDWGPDFLILQLLEAGKVSELKVGPWLDGRGAGVQTREVTGRMACPPSPVTPESSAITIRYDVLVDQKKRGSTAITWEAAITVWDFPLGDHFATVQHFALVQSGAEVELTMAFTMCWHKETWLQPFVERSARGTAAKDAPLLVEVIRKHVKP